MLSEKDVDEAMREVRVALLEADVALPVVRDFIAKAKERATGEAVIRSVRPADQVVKITYDGLVEMLGGEGEPEGLNLSLNPPTVILMAGLQGSGKTTTAAKLALRLGKDRKRVLLASLDTRRPAAMEQLATLATLAQVDSLPIVAGQTAPDIARRALQSAKLQGFDVVILDTAGRTTLDEAMMKIEAAEVAPGSPTRPRPLLVARRANRPGRGAHRQGLPRAPAADRPGPHPRRRRRSPRGRCSLDARGHRPADQIPWRLGKDRRAGGLLDAARVAGRILGQGDIVALVEKATEELDVAKAEAMAKRIAKGQFDLDMMAEQLQQMKRMGGMEGRMGMLPGVQKIKADRRGQHQRQDGRPPGCRRLRSSCHGGDDRRSAVDHLVADAATCLISGNMLISFPLPHPLHLLKLLGHHVEVEKATRVGRRQGWRRWPSGLPKASSTST